MTIMDEYKLGENLREMFEKDRYYSQMRLTCDAWKSLIERYVKETKRINELYEEEKLHQEKIRQEKERIIMNNSEKYFINKIKIHNKHLNKSLVKLCKQLSAKIGANVGYELEKEHEYSWEYIPMITLQAPCGCCYNRPILRYDDKDIISKLIKLRDADRIVRDKVEEYQYMYGIYFDIKTDSDWNKSAEKLANEVISQYDNEIEEE